MKRLLVLLAACAALVALPGHAGPRARCGLPDAKPLWIDFGAPELQSVFAKPGVIVAVTGAGGYPTAMRAAGVRTVFWDMYLNRRVGTPSAPADPTLLPERAQRLFDFAVRSSGCATPVIAMNELFGAQLTTPWTATNARYRANVLAWARLLAAKGARPALLLSNDPYTGRRGGAVVARGRAGLGLRAREVLLRRGRVAGPAPVLGNRRMRTSMRALGVEALRDRHPAVEGRASSLAFQTRRGAGGREGLAAVGEVVRGRQVAGARGAAGRARARARARLVVGLGHVQQRGRRSGQAGGRLRLAVGARPVAVRCARELGESVRHRSPRGPDRPACRRALRATATAVVTTNQIGELARVTGDAELALSALYGRLVESRRRGRERATSCWPPSARSSASASAARAARTWRPSRAGVRRSAVGRGVIADELRRAELQAASARPAPSAQRRSSGSTARMRPCSRARWRSPRRRRGCPAAVASCSRRSRPPGCSSSPTGRTSTVWSPEGPLRVRPLGDAEPLGALAARGGATRHRARAPGDVAASTRTTTGRCAVSARRSVRSAARATACRRSPRCELTSFLPYLALTEGT